MFDPFGDFEPTPVVTSQPRTIQNQATFDPFGGSNDFFAPTQTTTNNVNNANAVSSFDPFSSPMTQGTPMNAVPYDYKKKNIESLFGTQPIQPLQLSPNTSSFGGSQPNSSSTFPTTNNGFNNSPFGGPTFGGNGNQPTFQPSGSFQPVTNTNSNPFLTDNSNPFG